MSRRTKGFFDQPAPAKQFRSHWRGNDNRQVLSDKPVNVPAPPAPPIPIADKTKAKLSVFHFRGNTSDEDVDMNQPETMSLPEQTKQASDQQHLRPASDQTTVRKATLQHANTFPSTPGERLTLDELIGHVEDKHSQERDGPEEILGWNPNSSYSGDSPSRKRKRAQSSSPELPSAASQRHAHVQAANESKMLQTPMIDPATELWRRYGADEKIDLDNHKGAGLGLAFQASPRPLETPVKSGGFRRWASTGNDWPSSKSKRQRTAARADTTIWSNGPTKVAAMVEKMLAIQQANEDQQARPNKDPSSSSPLPETVAKRSPRRALLDIRPPPQASVQRPAQMSKPGLPAVPFARIPEPNLRTVRERQPQAVQHNHVKPLQTKQPAKHTLSLSRTTHISAKDADEFADGLTLDDLASLPVPTLEHEPEQKPVRSEILLDNPAALNTDTTIHPDDFDDDMTIDGNDEFGLSDVDEQSFMAAELSATQAITKRSPERQRHVHSARASHVSVSQSRSQKTPAKPLSATARYRRLRIARVLSSNHQQESEVLLQCEAQDAQQSLIVTLRGSWRDSSVAPGDIVHVTPSPGARHALLESAPGQIMIDDTELTPLLILHPDHMLSATTVADAFDCVRKAVLQDRIKVTGETSKAMVYGKILHQIFQQALLANKWEETFLHKLVRDTVATHLEALWELGMRSNVLAIEDIQGKMAELSAWASAFVREQPGVDAKFHNSREEGLRVAVTGLIAIEEHVWSPMFGLKGNVDATVQIMDNRQHKGISLAPFEVKTGRTTNAPTHHAQTSMYTLLMSDRYDISVKAGILYYLESSNMSDVHPSMHEIRQMVQQRNRVAHYLHMAKFPSLLTERLADDPLDRSQPVKQTGLPAMMRSPFKCGRCYAREGCFTFHALCEDGTAETAGLIDDKQKNHSMIWEEALGHLLVLQKRDKNEAAYRRQDLVKSWFSKWDRLLTFEEHENSKIRKELWTMSAADREGIGRGFANLRITEDLTAAQSKLSSTAIDGIEGSSGKIHQFVYVFERRDSSRRAPFNEGTQLTTGEPVVVSSQAGQWALAIGYVISATTSSITVAVDRKLGNARQRLAGFDDDSKQMYQGIMQVGKQILPSTALPDNMTYRLDKDEFANGLSKVRANLIRMMSSHPVHTRSRELIIFNEPPKFSQTQLPRHLPPSQLGEMNADQKAAANKVMSAEDYALVLGMPGTGKTTTIAHLIRTLLADGKSILLTSYTHTAVDNILLKLRDIAPASGILRFGMPAKVNPAVKEFCRMANNSWSSIEEIDAAYMQTQIVATTCMGTNHALFTQRVFDVCIIDEASQITLPISIAPLLCARKFILVGDHYQLPPLVQNQAALEGGLDMSLFRLLCEQQPQAIASLGRQYRMCKEIMSISNTLIYDGRLECGSDAVAERRLIPNQPGGLQQYHVTPCSATGYCWLENACSPDGKVLFLNTDPLGPSAREVLLTSSKNITNRAEAVLTTQLVLSLQALGIAARDIGVIALYRSQISFLRQQFKIAGVSRDLELDSADRFQGRDKEVIIISMVRSNESGIVGELIKDWRRLNVAFTRARSKLVVFGSRQTLSKNDLMARFLQLTDGNGWSVDLPQDAETAHDPAFSFTAVSPAVTRSAVKAIPAPLSPHATPTKPSQHSRVLAESASAGNRGISNLRLPGKVIKGSQTMRTGRKVKEQLAFEIMEDLMSEDWS